MPNVLCRGMVIGRGIISTLGPVAQPGLLFHDSLSAGVIEHLAFNQGVAGSNPVRPVDVFMIRDSRHETCNKVIFQVPDLKSQISFGVMS